MSEGRSRGRAFELTFQPQVVFFKELSDCVALCHGFGAWALSKDSCSGFGLPNSRFRELVNEGTQMRRHLETALHSRQSAVVFQDLRQRSLEHSHRGTCCLQCEACGDARICQVSELETCQFCPCGRRVHPLERSTGFKCTTSRLLLGVVVCDRVLFPRTFCFRGDELSSKRLLDTGRACMAAWLRSSRASEPG